MKRSKILWGACLVVLVAIIAVIVVFHKDVKEQNVKENTGIEEVDLDTFVTADGKHRVTFSDVVLSQKEEQRKLIVFKQKGKVSYQIEDRVFKHIDAELLKKYQNVTYEATGYFVVNLENLTSKNIVEDKEHKTLTIIVEPPKLENIEIDPNKIEIEGVEKGTLAFGNLEMTVNDYVEIQKELQKRLVEKFDTSANGQEANRLAIDAVKKVYEPVIKAVNDEYVLNVEFEEDKQ